MRKVENGAPILQKSRKSDYAFFNIYMMLKNIHIHKTIMKYLHIILLTKMSRFEHVNSSLENHMHQAKL